MTQQKVETKQSSIKNTSERKEEDGNQTSNSIMEIIMRQALN